MERVAPPPEAATDAFGMTPGYYGSDFKRINSPYDSAQTTMLKGSSLYNGNITSWTSNIDSMTAAPNTTQFMHMTGSKYRYDELNRLATADFFHWQNGMWKDTIDYRSIYGYDANGNILNLQRYVYNDTAMDRLKYHYYNLTNRLEYVDDTVPDNAILNADIDDQAAGNYKYDPIGNLTKDVKEGIDSILWTVYGKVQEIRKINKDTIKFVYDALGNRVAKMVIDSPGTDTTIYYYMRDASGNIMAIYSITDTVMNVSELPIYGSNRLGIFKPSLDKSDTLADSISTYTRVMDDKQYELTDHLGNVRVILSDIKEPSDTTGGPHDFLATIVGYNNYYSFGMLMPGRVYGDTTYRFGFGSHEKDDEIKGSGNHLSLGDMDYDPRTGRRWNTDPYFYQYPMWSPYAVFGDNPIIYIDPDGNKFIYPEDKKERRLVKQTIRDLKRSSEAAKFYINRIAKDKNNHIEIVITKERDNFFIPKSVKGATTKGIGSGGKVYWNPDATNISPDKLLDETSEVTPQRALLEEVIHGSRAVGGETELGDSKANLGEGWSTQFGSANEEIETNVIVNKSLVEAGKSNEQRTTYTFNATKTDEEGAILEYKRVSVPIPSVAGGDENKQP